MIEQPENLNRIICTFQLPNLEFKPSIYEFMEKQRYSLLQENVIEELVFIFDSKDSLSVVFGFVVKQTDTNELEDISNKIRTTFLSIGLHDQDVRAIFTAAYKMIYERIPTLSLSL